MIEEQKLREWAERNGINEDVLKKIISICEAGPTREVCSTSGNVLVMLPSTKNKRMVYCESRTVEYPYAVMLEFDPDVLFYVEQPGSMELRYQGKDGRPVQCHYTPDFFVIRRDSAGWVETKPEAKLREFAAKQPNSYRFENGVWHYPPAEENAAKYGLTFTVESDAIYSPVFLQNLEYLRTYLEVRDTLTFAPHDLEKVTSMVSAYPGITLKSLKEELDAVPADVFYGMIAKGLIWVDLYAALLSEPERVKVFSSPASAILQAQFQPLPEATAPNLAELVAEDMVVQWLGKTWRVISVTNNKVFLDSSGKKEDIELQTFHKWARQGDITLVSSPKYQPAPPDVMTNYSAEDWEEAARRCAIVEQYMADGKTPIGFDRDERTLRRWVERYVKAKELYSDGIYGLLPRHHLKGCRKVRITAERLAVLLDLVKKHYLRLSCPNKQSALAAIQNEAKEMGIDPPSRRLFNRVIRDIGLYEAELARVSKRAARKYKEFAPEPTRFPTDGERFLQVVHIDHTELPLQTVDAVTGKPLGKVWITKLVCSGTKTIAGSYLTYSKPSRKSVFMALRDLVERYGRFPETLVSDNAKEFQSHDYKVLAANYRIELRYRPPGDGPAGAPVERPLGTIQQVLINNLTGRTFPVQEARLRTGKRKPESQAIWTLEELREEIGRFITEDYDNMDHFGLFMTPREAREASILRDGNLEHRKVMLDDRFFFLTTPSISTNHGYAKVVVGRGIKVNGMWYNCEEFRNPDVPGTKVQVRMDPDNKERCYASVGGKSVKLTPHLSPSVVKKNRGVTLEVYNARRRATERAYEGKNMDKRGATAKRIRVTENQLSKAKETASALAKRLPQTKKLWKPTLV